MDIRKKLRQMSWDANKRTAVSPFSLIPTSKLDKASELHQAADYEAVIKMLEEESVDLLSRDYRALNLIGLSFLGLGELKDAELAFSSAETALKEEQCSILINTVTVLIKQERYEEAVSAALDARRCQPEASLPHLSLIAAYLYRDDDDVTAAVNAIEEMKSLYPSWRENSNFWSYLLTDIDYLSVRKLENFEEIMGGIPKEINIRT